MATYRFIGDAASVCLDGSKYLTLNLFGQPLDLTPEEAKTMLDMRIPILPDEVFRTAGFSEKELSSYPSAAAQESAPLSFHTKKTIVIKEFLKSAGLIPAEKAADLAQENQEAKS